MKLNVNIYSKCPKISYTEFTVKWHYANSALKDQNAHTDQIMQFFLKILSRMANKVDPDLTAPSGAVWSGSTLFAFAIWSELLLYEILGHFPYP